MPPTTSPLLIIHGWGDSSQKYAELRAQQWDRQVFCPDLPGFGAAPVQPDVWSGDDYAAWAQHWIAAHELSRVDVLAHSFGGRLAVRLAANHPELVRSLVLVAPAGLRRHGHIPDLPTTLPAVMAESYRKILDEDMTDTIKSISQPALILWGSEDERIPSNRAKEWASLMPSARLEIWPGDHWVHLANPGITRTRVEEFLDQPTATDA